MQLPASAPTIPQEQAIRLRRYSLAALSYAMTLPLLTAAFWLGFIHAGPALALAVAIIAVNAGLFAAFRSGFNLRFADPSLTKPQTYIAITLLMFGLYYAEVGRS
jgi:hypothetical protein